MSKRNIICGIAENFKKLHKVAKLGNLQKVTNLDMELIAQATN